MNMQIGPNQVVADVSRVTVRLGFLAETYEQRLRREYLASGAIVPDAITPTHNFAGERVLRLDDHGRVAAECHRKNQEHTWNPYTVLDPDAVGDEP